VTKRAIPSIIEHVSEILFTLAQFIFILWPLFIITALVYSFQGSLKWKFLARRVRQNLLITWTVLFLVWLFTLFAPLPTPSLLPEPWSTMVFLAGFGLLLLAEASRLGLLKRRLHARAGLHHTSDLESLKNMDPTDFEYLVAETYRTLGYQATHMGHSGDHGVDVLLHTPSGELWVVQCKRYQDTVGESVIRDLYGTMVSEKGSRAILVTTAHITPPAMEWARGKPIDLVDGAALLKLIDEAHHRSEGSLFDRLANWLDDLFQPAIPSALRPSTGATQPVRVRPAGQAPVISSAAPIRYYRSAPVCPNCGVVMVPRPPRPTDAPGRVLYRCPNYPTCRVVLEPQASPRELG
jgi:restriction system protein